MKRRHLIAIFGVAGMAASALIVPPVAAAGPTTGLPSSATLQAALDSVGDTGVASAIAEVRHGSAVWRGATGTAELGKPRSAPATGRFRAGSTTKTFVATVMLQLATEQRLTLDDTVERWLPGLVPDGDIITVRHLLQHSSGLYDYVNVLLPNEDSIVDIRHNTWSAVQLVRLATTDGGQPRPLNFPPGTQWEYSNTNYVLLGMIINKITGRTYGDEIERRIVRPLGLRNSQMPGSFPFITGPHAHTYVPQNRNGSVVPVDVTVMNPTIANAAGDIVTTTSDLNRFYRALARGELLTPAALREMTTVDSTGSSGLGLEVLELPCGTAIGHGGGGPGFYGATFTLLDGSRQISMTTSLWTGTPQRAMIDLILLSLCG